MFCQKRYVTTKRFGLEGGEVTIPALHTMIETVAAQGVNEIAIGMPHRGRLNTLVNIVQKPFTAVFSEFGGESFKPDDVQGSGDVEVPSRHLDRRGHRRPQRAPVVAAQSRRTWRRSIPSSSARCAHARTPPATRSGAVR